MQTINAVCNVGTSQYFLCNTSLADARCLANEHWNVYPKEGADVTRDQVKDFYQGYIACLNRQDWKRLGEFVAEDAEHNDRALGLKGYVEKLVGDFEAIPDLRFTIATLVCEPPMIAARLTFDCTPKGALFDIDVNDRRVQFDENVFYQIEAGKIRRVWSVIDTAAIARQVSDQTIT